MANRRLHPAVENDNSGKRVYKGKIYAILRAALRFGLSHRLGFTLTMVALLLLSAYSYRFLRQGFFPDMVYDQLYMEYNFRRAIILPVWRMTERDRSYLKPGRRSRT